MDLLNIKRYLYPDIYFTLTTFHPTLQVIPIWESSTALELSNNLMNERKSDEMKGS
jgi:hypothetical protein